MDKNSFNILAENAVTSLLVDDFEALREAAKKELIKYVPGNNDFEILKPEELSDKQKKALNFIKEKILKVWGTLPLPLLFF